jgi:UBX domain-containing protein 1
MERARNEMGAQSADEWQQGQPSGTPSFLGAGRSLNGETSQGAEAPPKPQEHTITFWQNGFTVDDGPLRSLEDPANAAFLNDINRGQMPQELISEGGGAESDVHLINKSGEPYKPPPVTLKPFGGEGHSMRDASAAAASSVPTDAVELVVDESQPTTTLQVRLSDGSRKVVKANQSHTVLQLSQHVATLSPGVSSFTLSTTFPRKVLTEMDKTLAEAGLLNETVVQSA